MPLKYNLLVFILCGFIGASLLVGWFIPAFYAWTDSDQSRPSPMLWQVPLVLAIGAAAFSSALPWLPFAKGNRSAELRVPTRFSLWTLLLTTTGTAFMTAVLIRLPLIGGGLVTVGMLAWFVRFWLRHPQHRLAASALVACMILPYAWVAGHRHGALFPMFITLCGALPTFFPAVWISHLLGVFFPDSPGIAFLLTAVEFAAGLWLIRLGPKRTIAYLLLVGLVSATGSLMFYQAIRA